MKEALLPILIQDPILKNHKRIIEGFEARRDFFLDGPLTDTVAILDFDPLSSALDKRAHFNKGKIVGWFEDDRKRKIRDYTKEEIYSPAFMQASVFATVLKTLDLFYKKKDPYSRSGESTKTGKSAGNQNSVEYGENCLGRPLTWAFNAPQLLVIPRAGEMANAYYQRDSHSLQFFYFPLEKKPDKIIYSCLSRDIVAHETGHAIIDGIAPHLMDAASPQSLAIHEALADIIAMLVAFTSRELTSRILNKQNGSIKGVSAISTIAEEFGQACGHRDGLRNLVNQKNLNPKDHQNGVWRAEPHALSEVLSGALFNLMVNIHEQLTDELKEQPFYQKRKKPRYSASGFALQKAINRFVRMTFRALDYLPVGCVSFCDYGRAMIAADKIAYPNDSKMRNWIREEFLKRSIITTIGDLAPIVKPRRLSLGKVKTAELYASDWVAYEYANAHRSLLGIPPGIPFQVHPRLDVVKQYDDGRTVHECIFKVSWEQEEENPVYPTLPSKRKVTVGSTAVYDWESGRLLTLLSNARPPEKLADARREIYFTREIHENRKSDYDTQKQDRDAFIRELMEQGALRFGAQALGPDGKPMPSVIRGEVVNDVMKLQNTFNYLHIAEVE